MRKEIRTPDGTYQRLGCGYDYQFEVGRRRNARRRFVKIVGRVAGGAAVAGLAAWWCIQARGLSGLLKMVGVQ